MPYNTPWAEKAAGLRGYAGIGFVLADLPKANPITFSGGWPGRHHSRPLDSLLTSSSKIVSLDTECADFTAS